MPDVQVNSRSNPPAKPMQREQAQFVIADVQEVSLGNEGSLYRYSLHYSQTPSIEDSPQTETETVQASA